MARPQISVANLSLLLAALPIWIVVIFVVAQSTGFGSPVRFIVGPLVLGAMTVTIHRLFREYRCAWGLSALAAAIIAFGSLSLVAGLSDWLFGDREIRP